MSNMPERLPQIVEEEIFLFVKELNFNNQPLGRGIFEIVEKDCIVVYYPILDAEEKNDGFILPAVPLRNGEKKSIIFINTFQTEEKQVFVAAHEYGHFLKVAETINQKCGTNIENEKIVNRFAAELLMPTDTFKTYFIGHLKRTMGENNYIELFQLFDAIIDAMNYFSVPYNAVVIRLVEVGLIRRVDGIELVDGSERLPLEDITNIVEHLIADGDYGVLRTSSHKKDIHGLKEILRLAEKNGTESPVKIERLRKAFGIVTAGDDVLEGGIKIAGE